MRLKVLACDIFRDEIAAAARGCPHELDVTMIGTDRCHEKPKQGKAVLQEAIDACAGLGWDALLIGYGLCGRLMVGIRSQDTPLVVPRSHDCLGVLFGSAARYLQYFMDNPGTYYLSGGWIEHAEGEGGDLTSQMQMGEMSFEYEELIEQFGEDNAKYLFEVMSAWQQHYKSATVILQQEDDEKALMERAETLCAPKGWAVNKLAGDLGLLRRWLYGDWNDAEFLRVPPGHTVQESHDGGIFKSEPSPV